MATSERPKSRLDDGRVNPEYTAWRKANKAADSAPEVAEDVADEHAPESPAGDPEPAVAGDPGSDPLAVEAVAGSEDESGGEVREEAEEVEACPDLIEITVDRTARNKSFVYGDLNGELVPIRVKKKSGPKLVGKPIPVRVAVEAGHTTYTHEP